MMWSDGEKRNRSTSGRMKLKRGAAFDGEGGKTLGDAVHERENPAQENRIYVGFVAWGKGETFFLGH